MHSKESVLENLELLYLVKFLNQRKLVQIEKYLMSVMT